MTESPRRRTRELVLKRLYAAETSPEGVGAADGATFSEDISEKNRAFAERFYRLAVEGKAWAEQAIAELSRNWEIGRIALIDRIVIRMAMVEIREMPDVPIKVAINEAIELARKFSTTDSPSFVNGILDSFIKSREKYCPDGV
jgi:N utilization substance protein B